MTTAFQSDAFQASSFQIDSGATFALVATEGADLASATLSVSALSASLALAATEGADTCVGTISYPYTVGKPISWVLLSPRVYTQKMGAKSIPRIPAKIRSLKSN